LRRNFGDRLLEFRLFGSYAEGRANEDSDVDILVVIRDRSTGDRAWILSQAEAQSQSSRLDLMPLVLAPEDLDHLRSVGAGIWHSAVERGIPL
jgi:predicted nucleotidyltransferase